MDETKTLSERDIKEENKFLKKIIKVLHDDLMSILNKTGPFCSLWSWAGEHAVDIKKAILNYSNRVEYLRSDNQRTKDLKNFKEFQGRLLITLKEQLKLYNTTAAFLYNRLEEFIDKAEYIETEDNRLREERGILEAERNRLEEEGRTWDIKKYQEREEEHQDRSYLKWQLKEYEQWQLKQYHQWKLKQYRQYEESNDVDEDEFPQNPSLYH